MNESVIINTPALLAAQKRWMQRLAKGEIWNPMEVREKIHMLPATKEGCQVLWSYTRHMIDEYAYDTLVRDFWDFLDADQKKILVTEVRSIFDEASWRYILWNIPKEERIQLMDDISAPDTPVF